MKKIFLSAVLLVSAVSLTAKVTLSLVLDKVYKEPNLKAVLKYDENKGFSDALIAVTWDPRSDGFRFELTNNSDSKLVIPWEECRFVDEKGGTFRVVHAEAGVALEIEAKGKVSGVVAPADLIIWGKKGWNISPIFQERLSDQEFDAIKKKDLVFKVVLPIRKDKIKSVYHFVFKAVAQ